LAILAGDMEKKHNRARQRRHEVAMQEASQLVVGGEFDDGMDGNPNESDESDDGGVQEW